MFTSCNYILRINYSHSHIQCNSLMGHVQCFLMLRQNYHGFSRYCCPPENKIVNVSWIINYVILSIVVPIIIHFHEFFTSLAIWQLLISTLLCSSYNYVYMHGFDASCMGLLDSYLYNYNISYSYMHTILNFM